MTTNGYATVSLVRRRELKTRIGLAAFIGATAWFVIPGLWPLAWFGAVLVTQGIDWAVFRPFRLHPERAPGPAHIVLACAFTLSLPVEAVQMAAPRARRVTVDAGSLAGRSILAADDHEVNRRILGLLLEPHGCRLTLVENGAEAVEAASVERFDAILMDMQMPVMDGLEATRTLRLGGANRDTPVIALTANAMDVHRAAWDAEGVHAFLTKPIDPTLLAETLAEACEIGAARAEEARGRQSA